MKLLSKNLLLHAKKILVCLAFILCCANLYAQTTCNLTISPSDIYYPYTTSTATVNTGVQYLCGPNTIVYDTLIGIPGCYNAYLENNTALWLKAGCQIPHQFWLKAGATLNIMAGTTFPVNIWLEAGAIINNPSSVITFTTICSNIIFPYVNCSVGILDKEASSNLISIYPQPAQNDLSLKLGFKTRDKFKYYSIFNNLGQLIREGKINFNEDVTEVSIAELPQGIYSLRLLNDVRETISKKFVITQ